MPRAIIVHCWDGHPEYVWYPWLKAQLEGRGWSVTVPAMPNPEAPAIDAWVTHLRAVVGTPNEQTVLVGHSIGCQTILRYVAELEGSQRVAGVVLVAGFLTLHELKDDVAERIAEPWLTTPINPHHVRNHAGKIIALFSDTDPFVPVSNARAFDERFRARVTILSNRGHFSEDANELPEALDAVASILS